MRIHYIIHESFEGPGAFRQWGIERGFSQTATHLYKNQSLPTELDFDLLVVLGGPQCPDTTVRECRHFNAQAEIRFIQSCLYEGKAVIGVCLGAQLIGEALGARYEHSPQTEIGFFPIKLTSDGQRNDLFKPFKSTEVVGHWHSDMPGLLPGTKVLAASAGCPRQIVEYSEIVYGFQCHLEFTQDNVAKLLRASYDPAQTQTHAWIQTAGEMQAFDTQRMNRLLYHFLDRLANRYRARFA